MTQILIAFNDNEILCNELQTYLSENFGFEVMVRYDLLDSLSMLEIFSEIEIVICTDNYAAKICENIIKNYEESKKAIDVLIVGDLKIPYPQARSIKYPSSAKKIISSVKDILGIKEEIEGHNEINLRTFIEETVVTYTAFNKLYFKELHQVKFPFNVYSRIKRNNGFEYTLKISKEDVLTESELGRLLLRTAKEFFVMDNEREKASLFLYENLVNRFHQIDLSAEEEMMLYSDCFEIITDLFKNPEVDKSIGILAKNILNSWKSLVREDDSYSAFIGSPANKKLYYGYRHSYMACLLMFKCSKHFDFHIEKIEIKTLYLCLFHDMSLQNERLLKIHYHFEKERGQLTEDELHNVLEHSDKAALKLECMMDSPEELTMLIREHHGMKNGKSFVTNLSLSISRFSMVFMVVEEFVTLFIDEWDKLLDEKVTQEQMEVIFAELKVKYNKLVYKDAVDFLEKILNAG